MYLRVGNGLVGRTRVPGVLGLMQAHGIFTVPWVWWPWGYSDPSVHVHLPLGRFQGQGNLGLMATHWWGRTLESLGAEPLGVLLAHWWSGPGAYTFGFRIPKFVSAH